MAKEFPAIAVEHVGGDTDNQEEYFHIGIPEIDRIDSLANQMFNSRVLVTSVENASQEFDGVINPAVQLLAVAIASCNTCPVKQRSVCTGMTPVNFRDTGIYQATVEVSGTDDWSIHNATEQLSGAHCGVNPSQLNNMHPIKVG